MPVTPRVLLDGLCFPEGPRWHQERLWFSDMHAQEVIALDLEGKAEVVHRVPEDPSGLGWLPDGRLLVVSMRDRRLLREDAGGLVEHADLSPFATWHCNDMVVDERGRAYVGNFGSELDPEAGAPRPADLVVVEPDGAARVAARELAFPNGSMILPDGETLVVGETFAGRLTAFTIASDGGLGDRRVWAELPGKTPDGVCLDAENAIWVTSPMTGEVLRVREGGEVAATLRPERAPFACMLGGPEGRTLFLCTARSFDPGETRVQRAGRIEVLEVDVPGAGRP